MSQSDVYQESIQLLTSGKTTAAITKLLEKLDGKSQPNAIQSLQLLQARLRQLTDQSHKGLITQEVYNVGITQINDSLLQIIKELRNNKDLKEAIEEEDIKISDKRKIGISVVVIALLTVLGWLYMGPKGDFFNLTLYFYTSEDKSERAQEGSARVQFNDQEEVYQLSESGTIFLSRLLPQDRGKTLLVYPDITGFQQRGIELRIPEENNKLDVVLTTKMDSVWVKGNVANEAGVGVASLLVDVNGTRTNTDTIGDFSIKIPKPVNDLAHIRVYQNQEKVYDGRETISSLQIPITIR